MAETFWHSRAASRQFADALADALLLHILEHHTHVPQTAAPVPAWLKAAIEHVLDHLCEPISLDEIADASGLSRAHFARSFKRQTGLSPLDFVMKARAERARELILAQPDASLASVAAASGFCDQSHLTNHFRRHFGTTPAAFRRHPHADPTEQHFRPRSRRGSLLSFT
jgi:AraC family transcriptional regulator